MSKQTLKHQVYKVLETDPKSRNSDIRLTQVLWYTFFKHKLSYNPLKKTFSIELSDLFELPREDNIKRIRAKIQNEEHLFVPTDEKVAIKRGFDNVTEWRQFLGYPTGDTL